MMQNWHDDFRRPYRCRVKYRVADPTGELRTFFRSKILFFLYLVILVLNHFFILMTENQVIRKRFRALGFAVESGDGAAPGAFVSDVSRDHLGALPAARCHEGWELLARPCQVSCHANARAVTAEIPYFTGSPSRRCDASAYSLGMKADLCGFAASTRAAPVRHRA